jgi:ATP-dependent DNA helicase RecG
MDETTSIQYVKGVGPKRAEFFGQLGLHTAEDLLYHLPRDYIDRSRIVSIIHARIGDVITLVARIRDVRTIRTRRGVTNVVARVADATGEITCVWFNQPFRERQLRLGETFLFSGEVGHFRGIQLTNPEFEPLEDEERERLHTGRIVPVYPLTEGLSQRVVRTAMREVLAALSSRLPEILPAGIKEQRGLVERSTALNDIHFPATFRDRDKARDRLAFEELFTLQLVLLSRRRTLGAGVPGISFATNGPLLRQFLEELPFELTGAQKRVLEEIKKDMGAPRTMHRLLQGDVGSGKTVLALAACLAAIDSGYQAALMAPTEILAEQHFETIVALAGRLPIRTALLTGRIRAAARREILYGVASGGVHLVCGTHALIQEQVRFDRLGVLVVDEQQRFGVRHRLALREKAQTPDILVMTATPIPRTLAMAFYGDLDISTLDELPPGRGAVSSYLVGPRERERVYKFVADTARKGQQVYIVYPAIDESDNIAVRAATRMTETLREHPQFGGVRVDLVHGRQRPADRERIMSEFRANVVQVLVSTTVIEVGVDVPNATVMVVENPERYGLAQLHQLRGRIGRGTQRSYFILLADEAPSPPVLERLNVLVRTTDGFVIAEEDLRRRGPGELLGTRQHGLPQLRAADLTRDAHLLRAAREDAAAVCRSDPQLTQHPTLRALLAARYGDAESLLATG